MLAMILNTLLMLAVAVSITGVINRTRAVLAGRKGLRFFQHLFDAKVLLGKGAVYSPTTGILFRLAPCVCLASSLAAFLFIPVADLDPLLSFDGDVVMVAYLLALSRVSLILAALDTGRSFEGMGASREALYGALIEPAIMLSMATLAMLSGYTSLADIFSTARSLDVNLTIVVLLAAYVFIKIMFVEAGRVPVDDPRTHLELTMIHEVMCLDYSGIDLAMIQIAGWLKTAVFAMIAADAVAAAVCFDWLLAAPLAVVVAGLSVGITESMRARNKLARNSTYILTVTAMSALIFLVGYLLSQNIEIV